MKVYSCRAECLADVYNLIGEFQYSETPVFVNMVPDEMELGDGIVAPVGVCVELKTTVPFETIVTLIKAVPDGHVMSDTLRCCALAENTLERDYVGEDLNAQQTRKKAIPTGLEAYRTGTGQDMQVHSGEDCRGRHCCIHNPSDHAMKDWPTHWRADRGLMERLCSHRVGHPDPDDIAFKCTNKGDDYARIESIHGCDGCCETIPSCHVAAKGGERLPC